MTADIRVCTCGARILVEFRWNGLQDVPTYYDSSGRVTSYCPGCGQALYLEDLRRGEEVEAADDEQ